jgi:hypothetical protein
MQPRMRLFLCLSRSLALRNSLRNFERLRQQTFFSPTYFRCLQIPSSSSVLERNQIIAQAAAEKRPHLPENSWTALLRWIGEHARLPGARRGLAQDMLEKANHVRSFECAFLLHHQSSLPSKVMPLIAER